MLKKSEQGEAPIIAELVAIKRLLIFSLLQAGNSQGQLAAALGVDQSQISRMMKPPKKTK
jgi:predicted XRE-type DNA-binding protein